MIYNPDFRVAFKDLYTKYFKTECYYVLRKFPSIAPGITDAENIVQDVYVKIFEQKKDLSDPIKARNLLHKMVHNACIDKIRAQHRGQEQIFDDDLAGDDQADSRLDLEMTEAELEKNLEIMRRCVDRLPEESRKIIKAIYFEKLSVKEIARRENKTEQNVRNLHAYAMQQLRKRMKVKNLHNWLLILMLMHEASKN
jgi:RNA polymerase sigma factor (sigma-70 family)